MSSAGIVLIALPLLVITSRFSNTFTEAATSQTFNKCCILGQQWSKKQDDCSTYPIPVSGVSTSDQEACLQAIEVCCIHKIQENMCRAGINVARKQMGACAIPRGSGSEHYTECCLCCKMGLQAALMHHQQSGEAGECVSPEFGDPCDIIFQNCCENKPDNYTDEDECSLYPGQLCEQVCINSVGSYKCACHAGYILAPNGRSCLLESLGSSPSLGVVESGRSSLGGGGVSGRSRTNPCLGSVCSHICRVDPITSEGRCSCNTGYALQHDGTTCLDVDECSEGISQCERVSEQCINVEGSYQCVARNRCPTGYEYDTNTYTCIDVDECRRGRDGAAPSSSCPRRSDTCVNTQGSYTCIPTPTATPHLGVTPPSPQPQQPQPPHADCQRGFKWSYAYQTCTDIDECLSNDHDCPLQTTVCLNTKGSYECIPINQPSCPTGYVYTDATKSCQDRNECEEGFDTSFQLDEECINTIGGYHCNKRNKVSCPSGHQYNYVLRTCVDLDECLDGIAECDSADTVCVNRIGSYSCELKYKPPKGSDGEERCGAGFTYNSLMDRCEDVDECSLNIDDCYSAYMLCQNTLGGYQCRCERGFYLQPQSNTCEDQNECVTGKATCLVGQRCANTIGSYACERETSCGTGYTLNALTQQCEDDDECALGSHGCGVAYQCMNTYGSYRCVLMRCPLGFRINFQSGECTPLDCDTGMEPGPNGNCVDMDECIALAPCRSNQYCLNTVGSYRCVDKMNCGGGYKMDVTGNNCIDVDECTDDTIRHECRGGQQCINRPGGYVCQCQAGYTYNSYRTTCEDINECERFGKAICSSNADCVNTDGSYRCKCHQGFVIDPDGKNCRDVNECELRSDVCDQGCLNTWGSYQCTCQRGYKLDVEDKRTCVDIDECSVWSGVGSLCIGHCRNTPGSYQCSCPRGYTLDADGRTCQDVDECAAADSSPCDTDNQLCLNTRGGYRCNTVDCPDGYVRDPDHNKVDRGVTCTHKCQSQIGESCRKELVKSITYSFITLPSINRLYQPMTITTLYGFTFYTIPIAIDYQIISGNANSYFDIRQRGTGQCIVRLIRPVQGPYEETVGVSMNIVGNRGTVAKHLAYINVYVSPTFEVEGSV